MLKPKKHLGGNKKSYTFANVNKKQQVLRYIDEVSRPFHGLVTLAFDSVRK